MGISINREHMKQMARELGIEITFDNPPEKCGVLNTTTGELKTWDEVTGDLFSHLGLTEEEWEDDDTVKDLKYMTKEEYVSWHKERYYGLKNMENQLIVIKELNELIAQWEFDYDMDHTNNNK